MFHIYEGFHLVDAYHKMRHQRKYHPEDSTKRAVKIALVAIVTLLLWNSFIMGHVCGHYRAHAAFLYG